MNTSSLSSNPASRYGLALMIAVLTAAAPLPAQPASQTPQDVRRDPTVRAVEEVIPSVVNVSTESVVEVRDPWEGLFRDFFGPQWGRRSEQSLGSGVIIDETGYVLTNFHVVQRASRITVTLWDGRKYEARRVSGTQRSDVALLKLEAKSGETFRAVRFAPDDDLLLGETVIALGNPFGLGGSVSRGILSSLSRRPPVENQSLQIEDWLQTDAAINPGNSGGPLINLRAELIGISVAVFREGQGIGFAIPVRRISESLGEIFTLEAIRQLWLGARFTSDASGVTASLVQPGSPAELAGLRTGDRITHVNGKAVQNVIELNRELIQAEREVRLSVPQGNSSKPKILTARPIPEAAFFNADLVRRKIGLEAQPLPRAAAARLGLGEFQGLAIDKVEASGPAGAAELRPGYLIQSLDDQPVRSVTEFAKLLYAREAGTRVKLSLLIPRSRGNFVQIHAAATEVVVR